MPVLIIIIVLFLFGCDTGKNRSVTGDFYQGQPGEFVTAKVSPDSLRITDLFDNNPGSLSYILAGKYGDVTSTGIIHFSLSSVPFDSLISGTLSIDIDEYWVSGTYSFGIYSTQTSWDDSVKLTNEPVPDGLTPIAVFSDTSSTLSEFSFAFDSTMVRSFPADLALIIKGEIADNAFFSLLSDDSSSPALLQLIKRRSGGEIDTLEYRSDKGTYFVNTNLGSGQPVISDANLSGFIMHVGIPDSIPKNSNINRCVLNMKLSSLTLANTDMDVEVFRLEEAFSNYSSVSLSDDDAVTVSVNSEDETYSIDLTDIVQKWHTGEAHNFGLMFKYSSSGISPNQFIMSAPDSTSFSISYTKIPGGR